MKHQPQHQKREAPAIVMIINHDRGRDLDHGPDHDHERDHDQYHDTVRACSLLMRRDEDSNPGSQI